MTIEKWRHAEHLVSWAQKVFATKEGAEFMAMLHESHIRHSQLADMGNPAQNTGVLGKIYGYDLAMNNIEAARLLELPKKPLVETFGAIAPMLAEQPKKK